MTICGLFCLPSLSNRTHKCADNLFSSPTYEEPFMSSGSTNPVRQVHPGMKICRLPKKLHLLIVNEFCERFCFYGLRTILILYFNEFLRISYNSSTAAFHAFVFLCYLSPLLGATLADGFIGRMLTIFSLSSVYALGCILLALTAIPVFGAPTIVGTALSLFLIAVGTGGIKPCVSAFGAEQIKDEDSDLLSTYFAIFYVAVNLGSLGSTIISPILRADVSCFGHDCYALAFGVMAVLMVIALVIFSFGIPQFVNNKPDRTKMCRLYRCSKSMLKERFGATIVVDEKYTREDRFDVRKTLEMLILFIPFPLFWALFDQIGSTWTIQAVNLDGTMLHTTVKPDQIQALNSVLVFPLVAIFDHLIYPLMFKINLCTSPLPRMYVGYLLASISFLCTAALQVRIDSRSSLLSLPTDEMGYISIVNMHSCPIEIDGNKMNSGHIEYLLRSNFNTTTIRTACVGNSKIFQHDTLAKSSISSLSVIIVDGTGHDILHIKKIPIEKSRIPQGKARVRFAIANVDDPNKLHLSSSGKIIKFAYIKGAAYSEYRNVDPAVYQLYYDDGYINYFRLRNSESYTVVLHGRPDYVSSNGVSRVNNDLVAVIVEESHVHAISMAWQIPQYVIITTAEVLFAINALHFIYSEAPKDLRSVVFAGYLFTNAFGNAVVTIFAELSLFRSETMSFIFFAILSALAGFCFILLGHRYERVIEHMRKTEVESKLNRDFASNDDEKI